MNLKGFEHFPDDCLEYVDDPSHHKLGIHALHDRLYVVTVVFNPLRLRSRMWNYWTFANMCEKAGAILYTVEVAFGAREFEITDKDNPRHLQLRAKDNQEIWLKENALNLLIERLPSDWKYVAWIDADVSFARPDWGQETIQLLQHYDFIQMFGQAMDYNVNYETGVMTPGYAYSKLVEDSQLSNSWSSPDSTSSNNLLSIKLRSTSVESCFKDKLNNAIKSISGNKKEDKCIEKCVDKLEDCIEDCLYYGVKQVGREWVYRHPGFCWAARRSALEKVGGLIDYCLLGSSDWVMSNALFGEVNKTLNVGYSDEYKNLCKIWEYRALKHIRKNVGYMPGLVHHFYHGEKKNRNYDNRWKLLVQTKYNPLTDIKRDTQGLYQLQDDGTDRFVELRDGLRRYARLRSEDSNAGIITP